MSAVNGDSTPDTNVLLQEILSSLKSLKQDHSQLAATVDGINGRVNTLAGVKQLQDGVARNTTTAPVPKPVPELERKEDVPDQALSSSPPPRRSSIT